MAALDHTIPRGDSHQGGQAIDLTTTDWTNTRGTQAIYVGGAGNLKVDFINGGVGVTITGVLAGVEYYFGVTKVYKTGTTATNLVALF